MHIKIDKHNEHHSVHKPHAGHAKLILSGEHSVVYGQPALAISVNRSVITQIDPFATGYIHLNLPNLNYRNTMHITEFEDCYQQIQNRYQQFLNSNSPIDSVLVKPEELVIYAVGYCFNRWGLYLDATNDVATQNKSDNRPEQFGNAARRQEMSDRSVLRAYMTGENDVANNAATQNAKGLSITMKSNIPIGCGMGSSAATIISVLRAITQFFNLTITDDEYHHVGCSIENLQHGHSSGIDLHLALHGGGVLFSKQHAPQIRNISAIPIVAVNTGIPQTSTGACIHHIRTKINEPYILENFGTITKAMDAAIKQQNLPEIQSCVRKNHALLKSIGVVPSKVDKFITAVNQLGNAAKISGAGTIFGEHAGIVIVIGEHDVTKLAMDYGYEIIQDIST